MSSGCITRNSYTWQPRLGIHRCTADPTILPYCRALGNNRSQGLGREVAILSVGALGEIAGKKRVYQAVLGPWESGRMPGAPPAEAVAAALRGLSSALDTGGASGAALGASVTKTAGAEAPGSGFS